MRLGVLLLVGLLVSSCTLDPNGAREGSFSQSLKFDTSDGKITVASLAGYCFDDALTQSSDRVHLTVMGGCSRISQGFPNLRLAFEPLVISTKIARKASSIPEDKFLDIARSYAKQSQRKGFRVLGQGDHENAVIFDIEFDSTPPLAGVEARAWLAIQQINGHLVTHTVFRGEGAATSHRLAINTVKRLLSATERVN